MAGRFHENKQLSNTNRLPSSYTVKPWTTSEKAIFTRHIRTLLHRAPGLLLSAAGGNKIVVLRISAIRSITEDIGVRIRLESLQGLLLVPDGFFLSNHPLRALIHELLHLADSANHLSYSKDWADFANPIITRIRRKEKGLSRKRSAALEQFNYEHGIWPDFEGCENLREAFASYFTEYVDGTGFPCELVQIKRFSPRFLTPTPEELLFTEHFVNGLVDCDARNFSLARSEFEHAENIDASVARIYLELARTVRPNDELTLECFDKACRLFAASGVPRSEVYFRWVVACRKWLEQRLRTGDATLRPPEARSYFNNE